MVPAQEAHAKSILERSENLRNVRFRMCPSVLKVIAPAARRYSSPPHLLGATGLTEDLPPPGDSAALGESDSSWVTFPALSMCAVRRTCTLDMECGMWDVVCTYTFDVGCGMWDVGCGMCAVLRARRLLAGDAVPRGDHGGFRRGAAAGRRQGQLFLR
eukprot:1540944-Rhodomonas_salina.2